MIQKNYVNLLIGPWMVPFINNIIRIVIGVWAPSNHSIQSACVYTLFELHALALWDQRLHLYHHLANCIVVCGLGHLVWRAYAGMSCVCFPLVIVLKCLS
jgi:hypothetical protein